MKLNTTNRLFSKIIIILAFVISLNAKEKINSNELYSFTVQKYRVDFNAQTEQSKNDIVKDYLQTIKLTDSIFKSDFKNNVDYQIANRLLIANLWAQKVMNDAKVSDKTLKKLFKKHSPEIGAKYLIRNILLKNKNAASKIEKALIRLNKNKRLKKFEEFVTNNSEDFITRKNEGKSGWIDENKLSPIIKDALKGKKSNDIIKVYLNDIGWQIILLEDFQPKKKATFEEAKEVLSKLAKQEILAKKIETLLK